MSHRRAGRWCCKKCGRLLAVVEGSRIEIRSARGSQYRATLPATSVCPNQRCKTLNELQSPPKD